jgi:hypothetical protein
MFCASCTCAPSHRPKRPADGGSADRLRAILGLSLIFALTGCAHGHHAAADASPAAALGALGACETRDLHLDDAHLIVSANADGTPTSILVIGAASPEAAAQAQRQAEHAFGSPHRDTEAVAHQSKWGLVTWTDRCGHPLPAPAGPHVASTPR